MRRLIDCWLRADEWNYFQWHVQGRKHACQPLVQIYKAKKSQNLAESGASFRGIVRMPFKVHLLGGDRWKPHDSRSLRRTLWLDAAGASLWRHTTAIAVALVTSSLRDWQVGVPLLPCFLLIPDNSKKKRNFNDTFFKKKSSKIVLSNNLCQHVTYYKLKSLFSHFELILQAPTWYKTGANRFS